MKKKKKDDNVLVCAPLTHPLYIADNKVGACAECGRKVQFRPRTPIARKLCQWCAALLIERAKEDGEEVTIRITQAMIDDFIAYLKRQQH